MFGRRSCTLPLIITPDVFTFLSSHFSHVYCMFTLSHTNISQMFPQLFPLANQTFQKPFSIFSSALMKLSQTFWGAHYTVANVARSDENIYFRETSKVSESDTVNDGNSFDSQKVYQKFKRLKILLKMKKIQLHWNWKTKKISWQLKRIKMSKLQNVLESFCGLGKKSTIEVGIRRKRLFAEQWISLYKHLLSQAIRDLSMTSC